MNIGFCIEVDTKTSKIKIDKKFKGSLSKVLKDYTKDKLNEHGELYLNQTFISYFGVDAVGLGLVKEIIRDNFPCKEILVTNAGCTISAYCRPIHSAYYF